MHSINIYIYLYALNILIVHILIYTQLTKRVI